MNYGPLLFLAAFFALASSWFGFVLTPQIQVGQLQQTNTIPAGVTYPVARPGLARQGLDVYRANGCAYCHSQQVGQTGTVCDVMLTEAGTNPPALIAALLTLKPGGSETGAKALLASLPKKVLEGETRPAADAAVKALSVGGAKAQVWIRPTGPDIARGWGQRHTVAEDFLFDDPVMLGSQRVGPDLANIGVRQPDANWHLRHLYAPRLEAKDSSMPPYRFLFETRRIERVASPDALALPADVAPPSGYEIVPKPEAKALAAYLISLRADAPLFVAPLSEVSAPTATNAPALSTNAAPASSRAK
jgi:cbb3-type cytochrome oxidase cytochrome c subunit